MSFIVRSSCIADLTILTCRLWGKTRSMTNASCDDEIFIFITNFLSYSFFQGCVFSPSLFFCISLNILIVQASPLRMLCSIVSLFLIVVYTHKMLSPRGKGPESVFLSLSYRNHPNRSTERILCKPNKYPDTDIQNRMKVSVWVSLSDLRGPF